MSPPESVTISLGSCLACQLLVPNVGASYLIVCISPTSLSFCSKLYNLAERFLHWSYL